MGLRAPESYSFTLPLECRFLLSVPDPLPANPILVLATHGYGMSAAVMSDLTALLLGREVVLASLEAPHEFYLSTTPGNTQIGYNWGTRAHWRAAVRTHHEMIRHVLAECRLRFTIPPSRSLLAGFSQPVGLNYRFVATQPDEFAGVIGICGGIPRDWEESKYQPVSAAILHIARDQDEFYPTGVTCGFEQRLRTRASDVEFHLFAGPHRFPSQAGPVAQAWLDRVFPSTDVLPQAATAVP